MEIHEDCWLARVCGHPVFKVGVTSLEACSSVPEAIASHAEGMTRAMYYAKVPSDAIEALRALSRAGFYAVDVNILFAAEGGLAPGHAGSAVIVEQARPEHTEPVLDTARSCFRYSRFHLDPLIPGGTADRIKREWVKSYFDGQRGDRLFVASVGGAPAGFLAALVAERDATPVAVIDLMGVGQEWQGKGVGTALVAAFARVYERRCRRLEVGTQLANVPSIAFYQRAGFALAGGQYVLHMHRGA